MESTPMEKVKAYHSIKHFLTDEQKKEVAKMLDLNEIDITKRIWGKDNELEFILTIHLLEQCKSIYAFEEGVSKLTNAESSDLFIELKTGKRIVVEVKSTEKRKYNISEKIFKAKQDFAKMMDADLYFAMKIKNYWVLYDSEYIESKGRKIELDKDYLSSKFNQVFGERIFLFPKGLRIKSIYSKKTDKHLEVQHKEYGKLVKYIIEYNDKKILTINSRKHEKYLFMFLYENIQDMASNMEQKIEKIDSDRTMIIEELTSNSIMSLSLFLTAPIKHMISESGENYDLSKYLVNLIDNQKNLIYDVNTILWSILFLAENNYPIMEVINNKMYDFKSIVTKQYPNKE